MVLSSSLDIVVPFEIGAGKRGITDAGTIKLHKPLT
jgi:hypothetical protein